MSRSSLGFALVLPPAALVGGWFLANDLVLRVLGRHYAPSIWQYVRALDLPQVVPYVTWIKLSVAMVLGQSPLAWFGLLIPLLIAKTASQRGDAGLARLAGLEKAGLLPQSILVGKYKDHHLWLGGAQHVINISPTCSNACSGHGIERTIGIGTP